MVLTLVLKSMAIRIGGETDPVLKEKEVVMEEERQTVEEEEEEVEVYHVLMMHRLEQLQQTMKSKTQKLWHVLVLARSNGKH